MGYPIDFSKVFGKREVENKNLPIKICGYIINCYKENHDKMSHTSRTLWTQRIRRLVDTRDLGHATERIDARWKNWR